MTPRKLRTSEKLFSWWALWSDNFSEETCKQFEAIIEEVEQLEFDNNKLKGGST